MKYADAHLPPAISGERAAANLIRGLRAAEQSARLRAPRAHLEDAAAAVVRTTATLEANASPRKKGHHELDRHLLQTRAARCPAVRRQHDGADALLGVDVRPSSTRFSSAQSEKGASGALKTMA